MAALKEWQEKRDPSAPRDEDMRDLKMLFSKPVVKIRPDEDMKTG